MAEGLHHDFDINSKSTTTVGIQQLQDATKVVENQPLVETGEISDDASLEEDNEDDDISESDLLDLITNGEPLQEEQAFNTDTEVPVNLVNLSTEQTDSILCRDTDNTILAKLIEQECTASGVGEISQLIENESSKLIPLPNSPSGINTKENLTLPEKLPSVLDATLNVEACARLSPEGDASTSNAEGGGVSPSHSAGSEHQPEHHIKWVKFKDGKIPVITQNENGPCPLIAIMNVLLFRGKVLLPNLIEIITTTQLMEYLGDCFLEYAPKGISEGAQLNYDQNLNDAISVLPKLYTGLDVNVRFTGVHDFEYTPECVIFDLLHIPLYHGWLVDPESPEIVAAVGTSSYNQLVEKIITNKVSSKTELVTEALIAESFLERSASQLTYHGLCELNAAIKPEQVCVLFRNNHFSTIYKRKDNLYQLVTDQGFLTESNVVWETMTNIDGDGEFVDSNFNLVPPKHLPPAQLECENLVVSPEQQVDQDYLVALSMHDEQQQVQEREKAWEEYKLNKLGLNETLTDEELARRLHEQEQQRAAQAQQPHSSGGAAAAPERPPAAAQQQQPSKSKKSDCAIL